MPSSEIKDAADARSYLNRFGYIKEPPGALSLALDDASSGSVSGGTTDQVYRAAISEFQAMANLPVTGALDSSTLAKMNTPRCGSPDLGRGRSLALTVSADFLAHGSVWDRAILTYQFDSFTGDIPEADQRTLIQTAFARWTAVVPLVFREVTSAADIRIEFTTGDHGDGSPFNGPGQVLAHAFFPSTNALAGDIHFDDDETWSNGTGLDVFDVLTVAVHEIGHSLGLGHTNVAGSTMNPFYPTPATPQTDDREGIRSVYAEHIWVASLYRDVLQRRFDDDGLDAWVRQRFSGQAPEGVARGFLYSPEHSQQLAAALYFSLLDRAPDAGGLAHWSSALENGMSRQAVIAGFLSSNEYLQNNPLPSAFVDSLYRRLLNRAPDPTGFAAWVAALQGGATPAAVANDFLNSPEYCERYATSLYRTYLRREPDGPGVAHWTQLLTGGAPHQNVVIGFVASAEYRGAVANWW